MSNRVNINEKDREELNEVLSKCMGFYESLDLEDAVRASTEIILKFIGVKLDDSSIDEIVNEMKIKEANRNKQLALMLREVWQITIEKLGIIQEQALYQYTDDMNEKIIGEKRLN